LDGRPERTPYLNTHPAASITGPNHSPNTTVGTPRGDCPTCDWAYVLACGDTDSWNNGDFGSTTVVGSYKCNDYPYDGPEYTYVFIPDADVIQKWSQEVFMMLAKMKLFLT
jgi:hypothetical protein